MRLMCLILLTQLLFCITGVGLLADEAKSADTKTGSATEKPTPEKPDKAGENGDKKKEVQVSLELEKVVVTGTRTERKLLDLSGSFSLIGSEEVENLHAYGVDELIASVAGVNTQGASDPAVKPHLNIRGLSGRYGMQNVLVLMDGRPLNESYLGDIDLRLLPVEVIDRIEIVKGPASALYGGSAISGVINIITKSPGKEEWAELTGSIGDYNTQKYSLIKATKQEQVGVIGMASYLDTDSYLDNSDGTDRDWQAVVGFIKGVCKLSESSTLTISGGYTKGSGTEELLELDQSRDFQDLLYKANWDRKRKADMEIRLYRNGLDAERGWKFGGENIYHQYTTGAYVIQSYQLGGHLLTGGADFKLEAANTAELTGRVKESVSTTSAYLQDQWDMNPVKLTLGLRFDSNTRYGSELSPRLGASFRIDKLTTVRAATGKAYKPPALSDLYMPPTPYNSMIFQGYAELKPQTIWMHEIGIRRLQRLLDVDSSIELTLFGGRGEDFYDYVLIDPGPPMTFEPRNVNEVEILGTELELRVKPITQIICFFNYAYTNSKYLKYAPLPSIEGNYLEDIPQHTGNAGITIKSEEGHRLSLIVRVVGDRPTDPQNSRAYKLHSFTTVSLAASAKISQALCGFAKIDNLFNEKYSEFGSEGNNIPAPGRTFTLGFSLRF